MSRMHLFTKQKELNAMENEKYLAIQEFKCNISPSNLDVEDVGGAQNDQTQQQIIQDKLEIIFDVSSHDSKNNPEMSHQLSENSFINYKKLSMQKRPKGQSNPGLESLVYSQSSSNVIKDKRHEGHIISMSRFKEIEDMNSKFALETQNKELQVKLSMSDNASIHRKQSQDENQLIQIDHSPKENSYRKQGSTPQVWYLMRKLMKIVKNKRLENLLLRISPFVGDKSHLKQTAQSQDKISKQQQYSKQELNPNQERGQVLTNTNLDGNENIHSQILNNQQSHFTCHQFSLTSTIYDVFSMIIAYVSLIYYSILLIIYPTLDDGTTTFRYFFFGIFLSCYILDIFKELIPISFHSNQKKILQLLFTWKVYLRSQLSHDIISLLAIIFIEVAFPKFKSQLSFPSIILLCFLLFKGITISNKWRKIEKTVFYSQKLTTSILLINLFTQIISLLHILSIIYYVIIIFVSNHQFCSILEIIQQNCRLYQLLFLIDQKLIGYYFRDGNNNSWITLSGQSSDQNILTIYAYAFQSCYLQVFHEIIYQPQIESEIYFFYFLQTIVALFCLHILNIGENNMSLSQKIELFNLINIKIEKDYDQQSIEVYKQYTQNISKPLQKYFQMIYLEHLLKQKAFSPLFSKGILKKSCRIIEEIFCYDKEIIYDEQNDDEISLFIIIEGEVSVYLTYENEQNYSYTDYQPKLIKDSLIGYSSFFSGMRKNFVYKAHDKVRLLKIPREAFMEILVKESEVDYQKFCEIKDRILFDYKFKQMKQNNQIIHSRQKLNQVCWACLSANHDISECTKCHYVVDKLEYIQRDQKSNDQQRMVYARRQYKKIRVFASFNKIQVGLKKFKQKNRSCINAFEQLYLVHYHSNNNSAYQQNEGNIGSNNNNSKSFFTTSDHQIPSNISKPQTIQVTQESYKNNSNKLLPGIPNNNPMASPNISLHAKDRSFSIQSLINLQMQESNKSPLPESQFKTNNSIPYQQKQQQQQQQQYQQNVIQEESAHTIQSSKRNTLAQLYPEKIQSDLNHGIHLYPNANTIPSSTYKSLKLKKYEDVYEENNPKGESPINSQYNLSRLSNNFTPSSKQNVMANQNFGDFKQFMMQQQSKNDVIVLQVEENIPPNVYEFNLNRPYESNNEYSLNVQYKNSNVEYLNRDNRVGMTPIQMPPSAMKQITSNFNSNLQYNQDISDSIQDPSFANSNNYQESTVFRQQRQIIFFDLDKMFITKNYFTDYNIDAIINLIRIKQIDLPKTTKENSVNTGFIEQYTFNKRNNQSPSPAGKKRDSRDPSQKKNFNTE